MAWDCPVCGKGFDGFRGYANHFNLSGDHDGNALAEAVGCSKLNEMYANHSENAVASELGVSRNAVQAALESCEIPRRGQSAAESLKNEEKSEAERKAQTEAAREKFFNKYGDGGYIEQWTKNNPAEHAESARKAAPKGAPAREQNGMAGRTGQDHPNWRGGKHLIDALRKQLRPSWWTVRDEARADECYNCGASDCKLDVHHIVPLSAGGTNEDWNLMTLCGSCHRTVEAHTRDLPGMEPVLTE